MYTTELKFKKKNGPLAFRMIFPKEYNHIALGHCGLSFCFKTGFHKNSNNVRFETLVCEQTTYCGVISENLALNTFILGFTEKKKMKMKGYVDIFINMT